MNRPDRLTIALAQINLLVGDVQGNLARTLSEAARSLDELGADVVLFPELTLSGYPPEDLLFHRGLRTQIERALQGLAAAAPGIPLCSDFRIPGAQIYNSAGVYRDGKREALTQRPACPITGCSTRSVTSAPERSRGVRVPRHQARALVCKTCGRANRRAARASWARKCCW